MVESGSGPLRVLLGVRAENPVENPYIALLERSFAPYGAVSRFTWGRAVRGDYDVLHIHWPETLLQSPLRSKAVAYQLLTVALLRRARRRRVLVVRTVHNETPHESAGPVARRLLAFIDRRTDVRLYLNRSEPFDRRSLNYLMPHGDYVSWYSRFPVAARDPDGVVFFGRLRRYKGLDRLVDAVAGIDDPALRLTVVGRPESADDEQDLRHRAGRDPRVRLVLGPTGHDVLAREVTRAAVAVFPYERFYNSGAVFTALSLGTAAIVPDCAAARELLEEFGPDWIACYRPPLDAAGLAAALERLRGRRRTGVPAMTGRDWDAQAAWLADLYGQLRSVLAAG